MEHPAKQHITSDALLTTMHHDCRVAWIKYESQYAGGMGGGRLTAMRAFMFAWDQCIYTFVGITVEKLNERPK